MGYLSSRTGREYATRQAQNVVSLFTDGVPATPVNRPASLAVTS
jgi:hypothetical protein